MLTFSRRNIYHPRPCPHFHGYYCQLGLKNVSIQLSVSGLLQKSTFILTWSQPIRHFMGQYCDQILEFKETDNRYFGLMFIYSNLKLVPKHNSQIRCCATLYFPSTTFL